MSDFRPTVQGIDHIALTVRDVDASRDWYASMFGLTRVLTDGGAPTPYLVNENTKIALLPVQEGATFAPPVSQGPRACHAGFGVNGETYNKYKSHLNDEDIKFEELFHADCRSIYFSDPDGYVLEVTTYDFDS